MLNNHQLEAFINQGFVRIDEAFPRQLADECRAILWKDTGCNPEDRSTWTRPVVWLGNYEQAPFVQVANTPLLREAYDQLVGKGRWVPPQSMGSFPVRFPTNEDTRDTGWHVDASFPGETSDPANYLSWYVNMHSRGRALLMLFLFSDIGEEDAPTRIRVGSHKIVARLLEPMSATGAPITELNLQTTEGCPEVQATGEAGTVYLCHPFLVHAAQVNRGKHVRFLAQPPLLPTKPFEIYKTDTDHCPVEVAIREALNIE